MAEKKAASKFLETSYFGLVIGLFVFCLLFALNFGTVLITQIEQKMLDFNFRLKNTVTATQRPGGRLVRPGQPAHLPRHPDRRHRRQSPGAVRQMALPALAACGPLNAFSRIKNQAERERALFHDVFFIEPSETPEDDALLVSCIKNNGRVFLETVLTLDENPPGTAKEFFGRQQALYDNVGQDHEYHGRLAQGQHVPRPDSPLKPYAIATHGYGHANFLADEDQVYRRQPLVAKLSELEEEIPLDQLTVDQHLDRANFERLAWIDKSNISHDIPYPLTAGVLDEPQAADAGERAAESGGVRGRQDQEVLLRGSQVP